MDDKRSQECLKLVDHMLQVLFAVPTNFFHDRYVVSGRTGIRRDARSPLPRFRSSYGSYSPEEVFRAVAEIVDAEDELDWAPLQRGSGMESGYTEGSILTMLLGALRSRVETFCQQFYEVLVKSCATWCLSSSNDGGVAGGENEEVAVVDWAASLTTPSSLFPLQAPWSIGVVPLSHSVFRALCWFWCDIHDKLEEVEEVWRSIPRHFLQRLCGASSVRAVGVLWMRETLFRDAVSRGDGLATGSTAAGGSSLSAWRHVSATALMMRAHSSDGEQEQSCPVKLIELLEMQPAVIQLGVFAYGHVLWSLLAREEEARESGLEPARKKAREEIDGNNEGGDLSTLLGSFVGFLGDFGLYAQLLEPFLVHLVKLFYSHRLHTLLSQAEVKDSEERCEVKSGAFQFVLELNRALLLLRQHCRVEGGPTYHQSGAPHQCCRIVDLPIHPDSYGLLRATVERVFLQPPAGISVPPVEEEGEADHPLPPPHPLFSLSGFLELWREPTLSTLRLLRGLVVSSCCHQTAVDRLYAVFTEAMTLESQRLLKHAPRLSSLPWSTILCLSQLLRRGEETSIICFTEARRGHHVVHAALKEVLSSEKMVASLSGELAMYAHFLLRWFDGSIGRVDEEEGAATAVEMMKRGGEMAEALQLLKETLSLCSTVYRTDGLSIPVFERLTTGRSGVNSALKAWMKEELLRVANLCTFLSTKQHFRARFLQLLARDWLLMEPCVVAYSTPPRGNALRASVTACAGLEFFLEAVLVRCGQGFTSSFSTALTEIRNTAALTKTYQQWDGSETPVLLPPSLLNRHNAAAAAAAPSSSSSMPNDDEEGAAPVEEEVSSAPSAPALLPTSLTLLGRGVWPTMSPLPLKLGLSPSPTTPIEAWGGEQERLLRFCTLHFRNRRFDLLPQLSMAVLRVRGLVEEVGEVEVVGNTVQCAILLAIDSSPTGSLALDALTSQLCKVGSAPTSPLLHAKEAMSAGAAGGMETAWLCDFCASLMTPEAPLLISSAPPPWTGSVELRLNTLDEAGWRAAAAGTRCEMPASSSSSSSSCTVSLPQPRTPDSLSVAGLGELIVLSRRGSTGEGGEANEESSESRRLRLKVEEERKLKEQLFRLELHITHTLKSQGMANVETLTQLLSENPKIKFQVQPSQIKKALESLINKDVVSRGEGGMFKISQ